MITVATLLTCHNRRDITDACLSRLHAQHAAGVAVTAYLTDDGSTDGTGVTVRRAHPWVSVIDGDGTLYWTGGTSLAEKAALRDHPDYLLWLNDDVVLRPDAIAALLEISRSYADRAIVVGPVCDPDTGEATYGGYRRSGRSLRMQLVEPDGSPTEVDTMNGNVVLVPRGVRARVGGLDLYYQHNMADMDYAFRARALGVPVMQAGAFVGECRRNLTKQRWADSNVPLQERLRAVVSFKAMPPRQWL